ncbi:DNA-(apurinic or apyrimidinic site) lyase /endonuclease III [Falsiroseomonas stagni DSM 19981]|uniref:Endonuclease III n=2 Tax=Falsiroseomonas TaxID=2870713 RepID=A0A1I4A320_9PROT|nr:DNA-(apurinic or apyrimidinic site) lyase /endonuclease III [Falsiroseomonas stagni DSM 19981]
MAQTPRPPRKKPAAPATPAGTGKKPAARAKAAPRTRRAKVMKADQAAAFLRALAAANPAPETELHFRDAYTLLVAVALSAQTTDVAVNKATATLFEEAATPAAMVALGVEGVARHIRRIGLWQGKARNVVALSQLLLDRHGGVVPEDRKALEALPGVGRKTANVVLNVAFGQETMAVDTHIFRLGNRTGIAPGKTTRQVEDGLVKRCPPDMLRDAHHWLILHGRYICKARMPECWRCPAVAHCNHTAKVLAPPGR